MRHNTLRFALCILLWLCVGGPGLSADPAPSEQKVAAGEYVGSRGYREQWTLWRRGGNSFEAFAVWHQPAGISVEVRVLFSQDWRLERWELVGPSAGNPAYLLQFSGNEIRYGNGQEETMTFERPQDVRLHLQLSLPKIVQRAVRQPGETTLVEYFDWEFSTPPEFQLKKDEVTYLGREAIRVAGREFAADKFNWKRQDGPTLVTWVSEDGILLLYEHADDPNTRTELTRYEKFADFSLGRR